MKIEEGMYVRFKKGKVEYIRRLLEVIHNFETFIVYRTDREYFDYEEKDYFDIVYPNEIVGEPSHNIIDLTEVGDYVNGYKVYKKENNCIMVGYKCFITKFDNDEDYLYQTIYEDEIKTIVTKEQFEEMSYKIDE